MKALITLALVFSMLLATGCQNTDDETVLPDTEVTDAGGESADNSSDITEDVTVADDIQPDQTASDDNSLNSAVTEPDDTVELLDLYLLSYVAQSDKDGNVVNITSYTYDENGNTTEFTQICDDWSERWVHEYDENGWMTKETYYIDDSPVEYHEYVYDSEGRMISARTYNPDRTVNYDYSSSNYDVTYDSHGKLLECKYYTSDKAYNLETFEYNELDYVTKQRFISSDGTLISLIETNYDEQGRITFNSYVSTEDSSMNYSYTTTYVSSNNNSVTATTRHTGTEVLVEKKVYDAEDNLIEHYVYDDNGVLYNKHVYEIKYDDMGNLQESMITTDADGNIVAQTAYSYVDGTVNSYFRTEYTYDEDGTRHQTETQTSTYTVDSSEFTHTVEKVDGEVFSENIMEYDQEGRLLSTKTSYGDSTQEEINEYDDNGNPSKITRYVDGELFAVLDYEFICIQTAEY